MGLFSKIKKGFKKIFKGIKKVVKKVVKGVKKVVKKISSSKILKALAIAAAVIVTGGAAIGAFTGGTATGFAGWMMNASNVVTSGTLFGTQAATGIGRAAQATGNFLTKTAAKPFASLGSSAGNIARGVTDFTGLTDAASKGVVRDPTQAAEILNRSGMTPEEIKSLSGLELEGAAQVYIDTKGGVGTFTMADVDAARAVTNTSVVTASPKTSFWETYTGKATSFVGQQVGGALLQGAAAQYIQGDPELQGSMARAAYEGGEYMDPLKVYASQQNINTDDIYSHMMYGNQDPSSQYGNNLYRQQTFGVA